MLFKAYPGSDNIKVVWMIPDRALWGQYRKGNVTENKTVTESIAMFRENPEKLSKPENDDLSDAAINAIYREISRQGRFKQRSLEASSISSCSQDETQQ